MKGEVRKGKRGSLVSEKGGHEDEERNRKTTGREGLFSRVALYLHVVPIPPL